MRAITAILLLALQGCTEKAGPEAPPSNPAPVASAPTPTPAPAPSPSAAGTADLSCGFAEAFTRSDEGGTTRLKVYEGRADPRIGGAKPLLFVSALKVNTDGTRISYHRDDPRATTRAINNMKNAMHRGRTIAEFEAVARAGWPLPRTWRVLKDNVIEKAAGTSKPCTDRDGYLVSMTSDVAVSGGWGRVGDCDQSKWIDAITVPALVLPRPSRSGGRDVPTEFDARVATNRTPVVAMTLGSHRFSFGIVGDKGPMDQLGEASVAMNRDLNGLALAVNPTSYADAVRRFQGPRSAVLLFPGAAHQLARPLTRDRVTATTQALFERWGGRQRLDRCLAELPPG